MAFPTLFDALKLHFKARGLTYADAARALGVSEATVKRIFSRRDCSLERFAALCDLVQVELGELARVQPRPRRLLNQLSEGQEEALVGDPRLLLVAVCALNQMGIDDMLAAYCLERAECTTLLLRLEALGVLELHPNDRIRLNVSRTFTWIPNGPIMRYVTARAGDYFDYPFAAPGESMRIVTVRVSTAAAVALVARLEQIAREYSEQHAADAVLPLADRPALSVCLAVRHWEPPEFRALARE
ncbi:MAG: helix-turn-helix transcriptional regulator [Betaproteobacteria bacterium]|jgi:transcriptional regulator with XRE-family HTH domain|nr:helix-turn-helix transcriptional regulator [Betaproteobacteria bacterium]HMV20227.1 helix-turn-helix transcriptional regulator [Rhodocyclaceae bacterium]HMW77469.1 helix-turn-helix transcriptional regulator [Rhodocyclaceae bacterium]HNE44074.1 helix-turn-helix transcriptional regulator [Rhodocyclaceae bacterium]HNM20996.1 helix-turn-helix transcriptional regulator [Rhodocyclaceae bacterium]